MRTIAILVFCSVSLFSFGCDNKEKAGEGCAEFVEEIDRARRQVEEINNELDRMVKLEEEQEQELGVAGLVPIQFWPCTGEELERMKNLVCPRRGGDCSYYCKPREGDK